MWKINVFHWLMWVSHCLMWKEPYWIVMLTNSDKSFMSVLECILWKLLQFDNPLVFSWFQLQVSSRYGADSINVQASFIQPADMTLQVRQRSFDVSWHDEEHSMLCGWRFEHTKHSNLQVVPRKHFFKKVSTLLIEQYESWTHDDCMTLSSNSSENVSGYSLNINVQIFLQCYKI